MSELATNARVVRALGMRSIRQTFRRPQLIAPIVVFPTLLLAIQTGGAGGAVNLPGFPPVQSFLQFMLAGAMMQSLMLAGNSGGIALAVDIEMGFTDRLFSAPIPRFTIVLGRLAGTAALGLFASLWFLAIGLIFGAEIHSGVAGALIAIALVTADGDGGRRDRRRDRAAHRQRQRRPGPLPAGPRRPLPLLRLLPQELMIQPAKAIAEYNPLSFVAEGVRDPIISGIDAADTARRGAGDPRDRRPRPRAQRPRPAPPAEGGLMEAAATLPAWRANLATIAALMARAKNELLRVPGAAIPGVLAPTIFFLGLNGVFGALTQLQRLRHRQLRELHRPGQHAAGRRLHRRRRRRQPRPRHRAGLARPPARLPRPALGPARRHRARGQRPGADPGDLRLRDRARARRRLARASTGC